MTTLCALVHPFPLNSSMVPYTWDDGRNDFHLHARGKVSKRRSHSTLFSSKEKCGVCENGSLACYFSLPMKSSFNFRTAARDKSNDSRMMPIAVAKPLETSIQNKVMA